MCPEAVFRPSGVALCPGLFVARKATDAQEQRELKSELSWYLTPPRGTCKLVEYVDMNCSSLQVSAPLMVLVHRPALGLAVGALGNRRGLRLLVEEWSCLGQDYHALVAYGTVRE